MKQDGPQKCGVIPVRMKKLTQREKAIGHIARRKRLGTLAIMILGIRVFVGMLIDSIARLNSGDRPMDYNYTHQPGGPFLRLIVCAYCSLDFAVSTHFSISGAAVPQFRTCLLGLCEAVAAAQDGRAPVRLQL
jgi:hypothetical protein